GLGLIREKLATTQGSAIALNVLVMNLQKLLELLFDLRVYWLQLLLLHRAAWNPHPRLLSRQQSSPEHQPVRWFGLAVSAG
ncbi:hypothetical protein NZK32_17480, partial [Cyanobium sp. FGCU-52]|nr:hypothetical protein [Cyanobium sp. FGCU52]